MSDLVVFTASYAPDFELCRALNSSVLEFMPAEVVHYIAVPRRDLALFSRLRGPRTEVWAVEQMLPRYVVPIPGTKYWLNLHRPGPPIRGWIMQQVLKIHAATKIGADLQLICDSDVVFVRPVDAETFKRDGRVIFYRKQAAVDSRLPRHMIWHDVARKLLGVPPGQPPFADYITGSYCPWDRQMTLAMQDRVQEATGRHWLDAVTAQLHFSENTLQGVFVDEVLGDKADVFPTDSVLCHDHWEPALDHETAESFARSISDEDVSVMISAKSNTPLDVRLSCYAAVRSLAKGRAGR
ncbi:MAG TPA: DUF6492 family protein [Streptosporangiaceae bacterium]|nr:DUF6492 family protein [Streptosporangiaceae bacterium]